MSELNESGRINGATFATHPDAGHPPRIESPEVAAWFWQTIFDFLEAPPARSNR